MWGGFLSRRLSWLSSSPYSIWSVDFNPNHCITVPGFNERFFIQFVFLLCTLLQNPSDFRWNDNYSFIFRNNPRVEIVLYDELFCCRCRRIFYFGSRYINRNHFLKLTRLHINGWQYSFYAPRYIIIQTSRWIELFLKSNYAGGNYLNV